MIARSRSWLRALVPAALLFAGATVARAEWRSTQLLGATIAPGEKWLLSWVSGETFAGGPVPIPARVARGALPEPTLCLTAGIHCEALVDLHTGSFHRSNVPKVRADLTDSGTPRRGQRQEVYYRARWVRVNDGGILLSNVELGDAVKVGDMLGAVTDPISSERAILRSPYDGRVLGMALNQVVIPGFAAFHIGIRGDDYRVLIEEPEAAKTAEPENGTGEPVVEDQLDVDERPE